jgi:hypothetical protein
LLRDHERGGAYEAVGFMAGGVKARSEGLEPPTF